ncbi:hypothetical protein [Halovenus salina]|uniref:HTH marR-type domain-containing protein n=1 Tax=Halovenus salina TaxID=1510225 RepID=A0ABD5W344_9EURY
MNDERVRAVLARLREHHGDGLETAITTAQVERAVRTVLDDVASEEIGEENTMHYGEEKSRNDFADERAGYLYGCMDPGDEMILDVLAVLDLDAVPATATTDDGDTVREKGRTFDGEDADTARAVLASVRENHVAQAAGRYARNADDPDSRATVYVHTDAVPAGYADYQVSGVEWLPTDTQREIIDELTTRPNATTRDLADAVGCTKEHARETLQRLTDRDLVERREGAGEHGADVYQADGVEDVVGEVVETTNDPLCNPNRWSLAICDLHTSPNADTPAGTSSSDVKGRATGDDPPPDRGG